LKNEWAQAMRELGSRSWEECLTPEERLGGPSRMGSSKYDAFKRACPWYYHLKYVRRMTRKDLDENLEIGGLFHECRALYYRTELDFRGRESQVYIDEACVESGYELLRRAEEPAPAIVAVVRRLWKGWLALFGPGTPKDDRDRTIGVEVLLEVEEPFLYTTRIDRVVRLELPDEDAVRIQEIKTSRAYTQRLRDSYRMDTQFLGQQYCWLKSGAVEKYGPLREFMIDLAIKSNPAMYPQEIAPINVKLLQDWAYETYHIWRAIQFWMQSPKQWPRIRTYNCRYCDAFDLCASGGTDLTGWRKKETNEF
jgi:hypothetical protein